MQLVELKIYETSMDKSGFPKGCSVVIQLDQKPKDEDVVLVKEPSRMALYKYAKGYCYPNSSSPFYRKIDVCLVDVIGVVKGGIDAQNDPTTFRVVSD